MFEIFQVEELSKCQRNSFLSLIAAENGIRIFRDPLDELSNLSGKCIPTENSKVCNMRPLRSSN